MVAHGVWAVAAIGLWVVAVSLWIVAPQLPAAQPEPVDGAQTFTVTQGMLVMCGVLVAVVAFGCSMLFWSERVAHRARNRRSAAAPPLNVSRPVTPTTPPPPSWG